VCHSRVGRAKEQAADAQDTAHSAVAHMTFTLLVFVTKRGKPDAFFHRQRLNGWTGNLMHAEPEKRDFRKMMNFRL
jgi:hypothetical protein